MRRGGGFLGGFGLAGIGLAVATLLAPGGPARAVSFGALGDSLTDEYQGRSDIPAIGWVEHLVLSRGFDFGPRVEDPTLRGEPRLDGFEHNWSRFGINVVPPSFSELNLFEEHPLLREMPPLSALVDGLAADIARGDVDVVYVGLGSNDFLIHLFNSGRFEGPRFAPFRDAVVAAVLGVVDALLAAGDVTVFVGAISPVIPPHQIFHPPLSPPVDEAVYANAVFETNGLLEQGARQRGAFFVNLFQNVQFRLAADVENELRIGEFSVPFDSIARILELVPKDSPEHGPCSTNADLCASMDYALNFWVNDRVHPNSIVQGLMANDFLAALNLELGLDVPLLTDAEILENAFTEPMFVPEPDAGRAALVAVLALLAVRRRSALSAARCT